MVTAQQREELETLAEWRAFVKENKWHPETVIRNLLRVLVELPYYDVCKIKNKELQSAIVDFQVILMDIENRHLASKLWLWR